MITIKYIIPINNNSRLNQLKKDIAILLKLTNTNLIIEEIDFTDSSYVGITITTGNTVVYNYFDELAKLPHIEIKDYVLRLTKIALDFTLNYKKALTLLQLPHIKYFLKLETILMFIQDQY